MHEKGKEYRDRLEKGGIFYTVATRSDESDQDLTSKPPQLMKVVIVETYFGDHHEEDFLLAGEYDDAAGEPVKGKPLIKTSPLALFSQNEVIQAAQESDNPEITQQTIDELISSPGVNTELMFVIEGIAMARMTEGELGKN